MLGNKTVLETRKTPEGMTRRRYERPGLDRLTTYEIPESVLRGLGIKAAKDYMAAWNRAEAQRSRGAEIDRRIAEGVKPTAIANEFGVSEQAVRYRRKKNAEKM